MSHYRITAQLGEGGMGEVYRAEDTVLGREVAIKVLPRGFTEDPERLARFKREATTIAALNHPHIVTIYSVEEADGLHFLTMELVDGSTLDELIQPGGLPLDRFFALAVPLAAALSAAHERGVVHRDLKPANIMVSREGRVKVLDFGLAKLQPGGPPGASAAPTVAAGASALTGEGAILGTVGYMSPEQLRGEVVDHRSDVFSLGLILHEMVSGTSAFKGTNAAERISSTLRDPPSSVTELRDDLPRHLGRVIRRCLERDPDRRYQAARDVRNELEDLRTELTLAGVRPSTPTGGERVRPETAGRKIGRRALVVVAVLLAAAAAYVGRQWMSGRAATGTGGEDVVLGQPETELHRLAVLPFTNLRQDSETDFLGYALADQVISRLEYLRNILVRPSSAVRDYRERDVSLSVAAEELKVDYLLTGSYLKEGDSLRLNLELVNASANESIWREPIEVPYDTVFALQDLVTEKVTDGLRVSLSGDEREYFGHDIPEDPRAYEYYLLALSYPFTAEGHELAVGMLRKSVEIDSQYAPAFEELGDRLQRLATYTMVDENTIRQEAMAAVQRALELNPDHLQALSVLSTLHAELGDLEKAFDLSLRALEVNPSSPYLHFSLGYAYRYAGLLEESAREFDVAIELDPGNHRWRSSGITYLQLGDFDKALRGFELGAPSSWSLGWKGFAYRAMGREEEALASLDKVIELEGDEPLANWARGLRATIDGDIAAGVSATRKIEGLALADGEWHHFTAITYCMLGDREGCLRELEASLERGYYNYPPLVTTSAFDLVRDSERFERLLAATRQRHESIKARYGASRR